MSLRKICQDLFTMEKYFSIARKTMLLDDYAINSFGTYLSKMGKIDMDLCTSTDQFRGVTTLASSLKMLEIYTECVPLLIPIMEKYPGKLFICGGSVGDIAKHSNDPYFHLGGDIDVFICEESAVTAEQLLISVMDELRDNIQLEVILTSNKNVTSIKIGHGHTIQFIRRVYPVDRPDLILAGFDIWPSKVL